ncbi:histidinol-phosphatase [Nitrincola alkalilacustris]|uniref:histidinol-phosphatase n=1 Tax=Nitrincola alkalilacustris TaxID=1571224 RepID=UPI00124F2DD9|nr:histidinol-phosphatase [Nitrincola alkalilacustris]
MTTDSSADTRVDQEALREFAVKLAGQAGRQALQWFRKPLTIDLKGDESPVTIADREVEAELRKALASRFPEHGVLGEEHGDERLNADYVWVVDPIDGTRSFITGWPVWGTLLAVLYKGVPSVGIIEMPALNERWVGELNGSTRFTSQQGEVEICHVSACRALETARFYTTSLLYFSDQDRKRIEQIADEVDIMRFGGDCYGYGLLACGHIDLVIESLLQPFDYLALIPIIEGAGGVITDWQGNPLTMNSDGRVVAAATPELHRQVLKKLA